MTSKGKKRVGKNSTSNVSVQSSEYDEQWIRETWGWDTPEEFIRSQGKNIRPRVKKALELADLCPGMRILDIGCGRGETVLYCGQKGIEAVGADFSLEAIKIGKQARATYPNDQQSLMQFHCGDVKELNTELHFDRIFMLDLVEHLHNWELDELLALCSQLLTRDGAIIIHTLPNRWVYDVTYRKLLRIVMPWLPPNPRSEKEKKIHINEMTIVDLAALLEKAGFNQRVWLEDLIVEQARWHKRKPLGETRGKLYRWLSNPLVSMMYKLLAKTPLKLLIVNEMYAVAWRKKSTAPIALPSPITEKVALTFLG